MNRWLHVPETQNDHPELTPARCFGAASAKDRLDVVVRDAINAGDIPGPRTLANAREIAKPEGELIAGITAFADGPEGKSSPDHGPARLILTRAGEQRCER